MNNRFGGTILGVRLRHTVAMLAVFAVCAAGLPLLALPAAAGEAATQRQIASAFATLAKLPTVDRGSPYLEGYDTAMRTALQQADSLVTEGYEVPVKVRDLVGTAQIIGPDEAVVPFTVRVIPKSVPSSSFTYDAVALRVGDRWKVSWTTMCLLVESGRQPCPPTPWGLVAGDVLPSATNGSLALSQGVVRPGSLAIAQNGGLLVSDAARNQILEWLDGTVSVVAGDGLEGFSGDGGPAVDAELNDPGELAVGADGTIYFVDEGNDRVRAVSPAGTITTVAGNGATGEGADVGDREAATDVPLNPSGVAVSRDGTLYVSSGSDIRTVAPDGVISTLVRGGPPYGGDVSVGGTTLVFDPSSLAFEGDGDLVVFNFSPKELFQVDPADGALSSAWTTPRRWHLHPTGRSWWPSMVGTPSASAVTPWRHWTVPALRGRSSSSTASPRLPTARSTSTPPMATGSMTAVASTPMKTVCSSPCPSATPSRPACRTWAHPAFRPPFSRPPGQPMGAIRRWPRARL
jgi:hypothetical protein